MIGVLWVLWKGCKIRFIDLRRTTDLVGSLREGGLRWSGGASIGSYLGPTFSEKVTQLPTGLYSRSEQLFICGFAFPLVLAKAEQHLGQAPTRTEKRVRLLG